MSRRPPPPAGGWGPRPPAEPPSPPGPLAQLLAHADQLLAVASLGAPATAPPAEEEGGLEERLLRLHAQESGRDTRATHLNLASNLLDRLVEGEGEGGGLAKLVVTLLPGDEGYTLAIAQVTNTDTSYHGYTYLSTMVAPVIGHPTSRNTTCSCSP